MPHPFRRLLILSPFILMEEIVTNQSLFIHPLNSTIFHKSCVLSILKITRHWTYVLYSRPISASCDQSLETDREKTIHNRAVTMPVLLILITLSVFGSLGRENGPGQSDVHSLPAQCSQGKYDVCSCAVSWKIKWCQHLLLVNSIAVIFFFLPLFQSWTSDKSRVWTGEGFVLHVTDV